MANENYDPYVQAYWGKGKGKKGKKGKSKFQYPYDGNKGYPSYENGKGKGGHHKGKPKTFAAIAYAGWTDQDWDQSWTWNEQGWYSSHETSSAGQALMAFHDAYEHHEKEAIHGKLIQSDSVSERNLSVTTSQPFGNKADGACHQPSAQSDLCDPGQRMYQIHGQLACNPAFYSGPHLLSVHPGRDQVHFCKRRNSQGKLDLASPISHNSSMQYQHRRPGTRNCTDPPQHQ